MYMLRTTKSALFAVYKDEWDTKEDSGKSMNQEVYTLHFIEAGKNCKVLDLINLLLMRREICAG